MLKPRKLGTFVVRICKHVNFALCRFEFFRFAYIVPHTLALLLAKISVTLHNTQAFFVHLLLSNCVEKLSYFMLGLVAREQLRLCCTENKERIRNKMGESLVSIG